eukprot:Gb_21311 [translate_table: standard]
MEKEEVLEEIEAVEAVYGSDCQVLLDFPPHVKVSLKPRTADDLSQQSTILKELMGGKHQCFQEDWVLGVTVIACTVIVPGIEVRYGACNAERRIKGANVKACILCRNFLLLDSVPLCNRFNFFALCWAVRPSSLCCTAWIQ